MTRQISVGTTLENLEALYSAAITIIIHYICMEQVTLKLHHRTCARIFLIFRIYVKHLIHFDFDFIIAHIKYLRNFVLGKNGEEIFARRMIRRDISLNGYGIKRASYESDLDNVARGEAKRRDPIPRCRVNPRKVRA